jgi:uncharacterized cupin superfamily protein
MCWDYGMRKLNQSDREWTVTERDSTEFRRKQLAEDTDAEQLGCSLYELPPGKESWPYHYHTANEEGIYVLAGSGTVRGNDETVPLEKGDYVSFPTGESGAHKITNTSDDVLRFLMVSTMQEPDVTVYPDSGKFGVYAGSPPGSSGERTLEGYYKIDERVDYWDEE